MPSFLATARSNKLPSANLGNATAETQFLGSDNVLLVCPMEGSLVLNNRTFRLRIAGRCGSGTTSNFTVAVYFGVSTTIGSNTKIATTAATAMASASHNFLIDVTMQYDTTSNKIQGQYSGNIANGLITAAGLTNALTSVSDVAEGQGFTVTGLFGSTNASNSAIIDTFELIPE
jgi:hypothetical protein